MTNASVHDLKSTCIGLALMLAGAAFAIGNAIAPRSDAPSIAVVFAPGTDFPEITSRLDGLNARVMRTGITENIVIVRFFDGWSLATLWRIGGLIPLNASGLGDCLSASPTPFNSTNSSETK